MIETLAIASGAYGMAGGQQIDVHANQMNLDLPKLQNMHQLKTGKLINASIELGFLASPCKDQKIFQALKTYGENIGLAFQIHDDILDITGSVENLGKTSKKDLDQQKVTYPALLGLECARSKSYEAHRQAIDAIESIALQHGQLKSIADFIIGRDC
jgi:geranylgeranyl pyrophosphate synthase